MKNYRKSPLEITSEEFRKIGYQIIDSISDFIDTINEKHVTTGETPKPIHKIIGTY